MSATDSEILPEYESGMDKVFLQGPTPPISLDMTIDSPVWHHSTGAAGLPKLVFTITSHFNHPITIRTIGTLLSARQYEGIFIHQTFTIRDIDTGQRIYLTGSQPHRCYKHGRRLGTRDEHSFKTLQPGEPMTVSYPVPYCGYKAVLDAGEDIKWTVAPKSKEIGGEVFRRYFEPGHRYHIGIQNRLKERVKDQLPLRKDFQVGFWWRYGTKEQVMAREGTTPGGRYIGWSEHEIQISGIPDVELAVEE